MDVYVGNISVSFDVVGHGPRPLVFLHGWLMSKESWYPLLKYLPLNEYQAFICDVRGFGDSDKPPHGYAIEDYARDIVRLIRAWNIKPVTLIGHSFGGAGSLYVAAKVRHYIDSLVVLDTFPGGGAPSVDPKTKHHLQRVRELIQRTPEHKQGQVLQRIWLQAFHRPPSADVLDIQRQAIKKIYRHVLEQTLHTNLTTNIDQLLPRIHCPTLVIRGEHDRMLSPNVEPLERITHAEFIQIPGAGHYPMLEAPEEVAKQIHDFLLRYPRSSGRR
ncbi:alpha/beta fold hydrolase [Sulfobacillus thermosulfidooxidans]|uniref:alpha/beta fold hydrolase n=1 Tax=Sulfobacillus thermosulfidooxidans TaxID=28034 RepID=UPI0003FF1559|nr:alpha/beta hydrolase [Sulfobacillus thermosulfidooxidans]